MSSDNGGFRVGDVSTEHMEPTGIADVVLGAAADLIQRNLEGVEAVVIVLLMEDGAGHICSSPAQGEDLVGLLEALASGLRES